MRLCRSRKPVNRENAEFVPVWVDRGGGTAQHAPQVANRLKASVTAARVPVFPIACWVLGLMAFGQLLVAGLALGARLEASRQVRVVEREVTKVVAVPAAPRVGEVPAAVVTRPPVPVAAPRAPPHRICRPPGHCRCRRWRIRSPNNW